MSLSEFEERRIAKIVGKYLEARRPPVHLRQELDFSVRIDGQSVFIDTCRRVMDGSQVQFPIDKSTWVKSQQVWKIYWMRASGRWQGYEPCAEVTTIEAFCNTVEDDVYGCFWG